MKRLFVICFILLQFISCSKDDNNLEYKIEPIPVQAADLPEEFKLGETYPLKISYFKTSTCYSFKEFFFLKKNNLHTIFPIDYVFQEDNCEILDGELIEKSFNFIVESNAIHTFRFWQGKDLEGADKYLTFEVPVIE